ncbi:MAG TPA: oligosaccharide flippase family protein [Candidatus Paceibacterota bacterium]|nr:oligosaccharide flippase family protein [Candidatus Paceibacterota bacterium]
MASTPKERLHAVLRWSERYTKTDMVYLFTAGWWVNLNFVIVSLLSLLLSIALANLLPKETYGLYQYLLSLSALVGALMLGGMGNAVTQAVARGYEGALRSAVGVQLRWGMVPALLSLVGAGYYFLHGNMDVAFGLGCIAVATPLVNAFSTYNAYLTGKREFRQSFYYSSIVTGAYYAAIFVSLLFLRSAPLLLLVNLGVNAVASAYVYWLTLRRYQPGTATDPGMIPYGSHLSVMSGFSTLLSQLDSVLVFHFLGPVPLAVYSLATAIPERAGGAFNFIGTALLPKLANHSHDHIRQNILPKLARLAALSAAGAIAYAVFAPFLFHLVFPQYASAIPYTEAYALIIMLMTVLNTLTTVFVAMGKKRELYALTVGNPVVLLVFQVPLLLTFGVMGMIVARMAADALAIVVGMVLLVRDASRETALR